MITLRSFMKYCLHHDLPHVSPEKILLSKIRDKHIRFLSKEAMRKFMATILPGRIQDTRDYAIICLIYSTGLRISELTALNRRNFQEHQSEITVL
jgi:site-specific recombinase XerD